MKNALYYENKYETITNNCGLKRCFLDVKTPFGYYNQILFT